MLKPPEVHYINLTLDNEAGLGVEVQYSPPSPTIYVFNQAHMYEKDLFRLLKQVEEQKAICKALK